MTKVRPLRQARGPPSTSSGTNQGGKTKTGGNVAVRLAPPEVEILNLWNDFRKVVEFPEINREWLKGRMLTIVQC